MVTIAVDVLKMVLALLYRLLFWYLFPQGSTCTRKFKKLLDIKGLCKKRRNNSRKLIPEPFFFVWGEKKTRQMPIPTGVQGPDNPLLPTSSSSFPFVWNSRGGGVGKAAPAPHIWQRRRPLRISLHRGGIRCPVERAGWRGGLNAVQPKIERWGLKPSERVWSPPCGKIRNLGGISGSGCWRSKRWIYRKTHKSWTFN